jgi:hypothetical protein
MHQWDPTATAYRHPESERGGLYCGTDGIARKPFPDRDYCYQARRTLLVVSYLGQNNFICQTVLPGDEAMRIANPVMAGGMQRLAVPGIEYWVDSGSHYYVNSGGYDVNTACVWGSRDIPAGNVSPPTPRSSFPSHHASTNPSKWAPYIIALKEREDGIVFLTVGWNPVWLETATPFRSQVPDFGIKVVCHGPHCENTPCTIDPAVHSVNQISHPQNHFSGAGGGAACVTNYSPFTDDAKVVLFPAGQGHIHN